MEVKMCLVCNHNHAEAAHPAYCWCRVGDSKGSDADADHAALVAYLLSAVRRKDWHAVSDAANDLRVLEAKRQ